MSDEKETTAIQTKDQVTQGGLIAMMKASKEAGIEAKDIKEFMDLQIQYERQQRELRLQDEAIEAEREFNKAMARAHANISIVAKTKVNKQTNSRYSELDAIIVGAKPAYTDEGFSISFYEGESPYQGHVRVFADVCHALGHKITRHYDVPLDGAGLKGNTNMIPIHAKASSISYGRRYLMCLIWNIPTGDDDDGNRAGNSSKTPLNDEQKSTLRNYMTDRGVSEQNLCNFLNVQSFSDIHADLYDKAIQSLKNIKPKEQK